MSVKLDSDLATSGTQFLIFPQPRFLTAFTEPEVVTVSVRPENIKPGPSDDRMFVVDAVNKMPYSKLLRPPYRDERFKPVEANSEGHFTHLDVNSREFSCATMYATVRRVLDIWEDYFQHPIYWHFETDFERLELIPLIEWDNAQSGYGFLEFGYARKDNGGIDHTRPYCQNFDVLAHELGHSIIFAEVGVPSSQVDDKIDYMAMHESGGDLVAIIASLHFNSVIDQLLKSTKGNLFTINELDRVGELSESRQVRIAFNSLRMSDIGAEPHARSLPLTGGLFDIMVEVFQKELVKRGLITLELAELSTQGPGRGQNLELIRLGFEGAYTGNEAAFKDALLVARDYLGRLLAHTWSKLSPDFLSYHDFLRQLLKSDRELGGEHQKTIRECFSWREITLLPNSILLKPHTLKECGLQNQRSYEQSLEDALINFVDLLKTSVNGKEISISKNLIGKLKDELSKIDH
jgi:hypothetical protein